MSSSPLELEGHKAVGSCEDLCPGSLLLLDEVAPWPCDCGTMLYKLNRQLIMSNAADSYVLEWLPSADGGERKF